MKGLTSPLPEKTVLCIVGPTGSGKTAAATHLADQRALSVINADSRQVYRDFPLITAQPDKAERAACPHFLYGYLDSMQKTSAGTWAQRATECINQQHAAGRLPVVLGGTGLYVKALFDGMAEIPHVDPAIARGLETLCREAGGLARLYARLCEIDSAYAARIHPNDRQRTVRALEVWEGTGKTLSWWHAHPYGDAGEGQNAADSSNPVDRYGWQVLRIGLLVPRQELLLRLERRIAIMLAEGAVEEARAVFEKYPDRSAPAWSGIGCAELYSYLSGEISIDECRGLWLRNTAAYAKRQMTWFRADSRIRWVPYDDASALALALENAVTAG